MRITSISAAEYTISNNRMQNHNTKHTCIQKPYNVNFKGKFGTILGGIVGVAATTVASFTIAPAIIGLVGIGAVAGAIGGDALEDTINNEDEKK